MTDWAAQLEIGIDSSKKISVPAKLYAPEEVYRINEYVCALKSVV